MVGVWVATGLRGLISVFVKRLMLLVTMLLASLEGVSVYAQNESASRMVPIISELLFDDRVEVPDEPDDFQTQVTLVTDEDVTPRSNELVTFGLPLAVGLVQDSAEIQVVVNGQVRPVFVECKLTWHFSDPENSCRSVTIQLQGVDMRSGNVVVDITDAGRNTATDLQERPHQDGWVQGSATQANLYYPRVFAIHDMAYLDKTGIVPSYRAPETSDGFSALQSKQFDNWAGQLDYSSISTSNFLFDRSTAMFKAYMGSGDVKFLKQAFLTKQLYFQHVRNTGGDPRPQGGEGCFEFDNARKCPDPKYIYTQPAKLALALVGDDSQWDHQLIVNMALQSDIGWFQAPSRDLYDSESESFTERGVGLTGITEVNAYEITGDATVLEHIEQRIASLKDMQQTVKSWDTANGWTPKSGAFTHSWKVHEGGVGQWPGPGVTDDRRFSPWMSENVADFLWHAYHYTDVQGIPEMLRRLGNAIDLYGFASNYVSGIGVNAVYARKTGAEPDEVDNNNVINGWNSCNGPDEAAVELMYFGSAYASPEALESTHRSEGYTDQHNVEVVLSLALAYRFETNPAARQRLRARVEKIIEQWTETDVEDCSRIGSHMRLWNWQHRSNSFRTWDWVKTGGQLPAGAIGGNAVLQ